MNSSDAVPLQLVPSLDDTFGALLIGTCLAAMLYGLTTHQCYRYLRLYPADGWGLKSMVACLWLLDTFHTTLSVHTWWAIPYIGHLTQHLISLIPSYFYLVTSYSNPESLPNGVWSARLLVSITSIVTAISHLFLSRRLYLLGNRSATLVVAFVSTADARKARFRSWYGNVESTFLHLSLTFCYASAVNRGAASFCVTGNSQLTWVAVADLLIIGFRGIMRCEHHDCPVRGPPPKPNWIQTHGLPDRRDDSVHDQHRFIDRVSCDPCTVFGISTTIMSFRSSMFTLAALICAAAMPRNFIYLALYIIVSKMYTNSLLAILNSRRSIVDRGAEGMETGSFGLANPAEMRTSRRWDAASPSVRQPSAGKKSAVIDVKVTTETVQQIDTEEQFHENRLSSLKEAFAI
ncbi:hypothetical protein A0H81_13211 [Grifola frondosa]|uniref:DUF6534 domain-containing protein n=1 Tax=Grifola frondosa TaxID=5627 RepID=A0A1C7LQF4_GRIFR|nr:hypothetical protein A0H81_13211 [Grifola frondosa]